MLRDSIRAPKLGEPSSYVCPQCDLSFVNQTLEDQSRIYRHLILHVPDSSTRWSLMDAWRAEEQGQRDEAAFG